MSAKLRPLLLLAVACGGDRDSSTHGEMPYCDDTRTELALDAVTPLGFSGADLVAGIPATETATLTWADDATTALTLTFAPGDRATHVDSEAVYPEGGEGPAIGIECPDRVEVGGGFTFTTADGAFAESWEVAVRGTEPAPLLRVELDLDGLSGTFDLVPFVTAEGWDDLSAAIEVSWADGASAGVIEGQASGSGPCEDDDDCTAWSESVDVAAWGAASE